MSGELTIREASDADLDGVLSIENQSFEQESFSTRQFRYLMKSPTCNFVVATRDSKIVGYLILLRRSTSRRLRVYSIAVDLGCRGMGIGKRLLNYAQAEAERGRYPIISLEVKKSNEIAVALYTKFGFRICGCKSDYYGPGQHALIMQLSSWGYLNPTASDQ